MINVAKAVLSVTVEAYLKIQKFELLCFCVLKSKNEIL